MSDCQQQNTAAVMLPYIHSRIRFQDQGYVDGRDRHTEGLSATLMHLFRLLSSQKQCCFPWFAQLI